MPANAAASAAGTDQGAQVAGRVVRHRVQQVGTAQVARLLAERLEAALGALREAGAEVVTVNTFPATKKGEDEWGDVNKGRAVLTLSKSF